MVEQVRLITQPIVVSLIQIPDLISHDGLMLESPRALAPRSFNAAPVVPYFANVVAIIVHGVESKMLIDVRVLMLVERFEPLWVLLIKEVADVSIKY